MTHTEIRLACLHAAINRPGPRSAADVIVADARVFAEFLLGDDDGDDAPADGGEPRPDIDVTIKGRFPVFTGGFRDGPASEP